MGNATYQQVINWGVDFPYPDKQNYVITRRKNLKPTEFVEFIGENHVERIQQVKMQGGKDIGLVGGGQVNALVMEAGLIDEMWVHIMPVVLGEGKALFPGLKEHGSMVLFHQKVFDNGVLALRYKLI